MEKNLKKKLQANIPKKMDAQFQRRFYEEFVQEQKNHDGSVHGQQEGDGRGPCG